MTPRVLISFGLIGTALLEPALTGNGEDDAKNDRLVAELTRFLLYGIARRPPPRTEAGGAPTGLAESDLARLLDRIVEAERRAVRAELQLEQATGAPALPPATELEARRGAAERTPTRRRRQG